MLLRSLFNILDLFLRFVKVYCHLLFNHVEHHFRLMSSVHVGMGYKCSLGVLCLGYPDGCLHAAHALIKLDEIEQ